MNAPKLDNPALLQEQLYIDGHWIDSSDNVVEPVLNPANGEQVGAVQCASLSQVDAAIEAAERALVTWRQVPAAERSIILRRWQALLIVNRKDLAKILTAEQGKPLAEAGGEIDYGIGYIEWFAEEAKRIEGDLIEPPARDKRMLVSKEPVGVVAAITPWNFPNAMLTRKIAPALAAGCTVVCKPALNTPLSALAVVKLAVEAGVPAGVINVVNGDAEPIGEKLTQSPVIRKVSFTGSTRVGKYLMEKSAGTLKRLSLELGGNAPFIVFDDADVDLAVAGLLSNKFRNAGQTCICANRVFVQSSVFNRFKEKLLHGLENISVGAGDEADVDLGPLIDIRAARRVDGLIEQALSAGASIAFKGVCPGTDCFRAPTVVENVDHSMALCQQEVFGPVITLLRFQTEDEVIAMANSASTGLAGYFYSRDIGRTWRVADALECGMVGVNETAISSTAAPFGGVKESGFGREGSRYGLDDYLEIKYRCIGGI